MFIDNFVCLLEFCYLCYFLVLVNELYYGWVVQCLVILQLLLLVVIQQLEVSVGVCFFDCDSKGVCLMFVGDVFCGSVQVLFDCVEDVCVLVWEVQVGEVGWLCLGFVGFMLFNGFLSWLQVFYVGYVRVEVVVVELNFQDQIDVLFVEDLDFGFVYIDCLLLVLVFMLLYSEFFFVCLLVGYLLVVLVQILLVSLSDQFFIFFLCKGLFDYYVCIVDICCQYGFYLWLQYEGWYWLLVVLLVVQGMGVSIVFVVFWQVGIQGVEFRLLIEVIELLVVFVVWWCDVLVVLCEQFLVVWLG